MQEFSSVIASSYDAASLAPMLDEKASDGWSIVSIVAAGTNIVAYLSREVDTTDAAAAATGEETTTDAGADADSDTDSGAEIAATAEPAGWGSAPETGAGAETDTGTTSGDQPGESAPETGDAGVGASIAAAGSGAETQLAADEATTIQVDSRADDTTTGSSEPATDTPTEQSSATDTEPDSGTETAAAGESASADTAVPAGWYADPSGRYELRYWDGTAWTEHVSRAGQQYTDPPVA